MLRHFLFIFSVFISVSSSAQFVLEGMVMDADRQPLAFVNITPEGQKESSASTIDGKFRIRIPAPGTIVVFSYVGYKPYQYLSQGNERDLNIVLEKQSYELGEISVQPGENPAHRIIRKATANRDSNNPDKISSYTCTAYSKTCYDLVLNNEDIRTKADSAAADSVRSRMRLLSEESHVLLLESVTERKYLFPGNLNEQVIATRVSGFREPSFSTSAADLQPFGFYEDYFRIIGKEYLNPISAGSTSRYFFSIEDTLYQQKDTIYIIYFRPLKGKKFEGLEGLLYIHTHGYAIQNVIAAPYEKGLIDVKIQQQYRLIDGKQWFPEQLNYELHYKKFPSPMMGMKLNGKSYIREVMLKPELHKKDFSPVTIAMAPDAARKDESFWEQQRVDSLSRKERRTYVLMDSIGQKQGFDRTLRIVEALISFQLPVSIFNIDLNRIFSMNEYETVRLGIGLHTNDKLSRWFSLGGYIGYGYADSVVKYGADLKLYLQRDSREYYLKYLFSSDLSEPAQSQYFYARNNINRNIITWKMDYMEQHELSLNGRLLRHLVLNLSLNRHIRKPQYNYLFLQNLTADPTEVSTEFRSTEFRIKGRMAYKERLVKAFGQMLSEGSDFPVLSVAYTHGFKTPAHGFYHYDKLSIGIERSFMIRNLGRSHILLEGGYVKGNVPYPYLFNGNGSDNADNYLYVENTFQTMGLYEFVSDRYANLFFSHRFAAPFFRHPKSQPQLSIYTNIAFGALSEPARHRNRYYHSMENGYYESGLFLDNLLRGNYLNVAYLGLGGGAFFRYGPYAHRDLSDNLAYRLSLRFSF